MTEAFLDTLAAFVYYAAFAGIAYALCWFAIQGWRGLLASLRNRKVARNRRELARVIQQMREREQAGTWDTRYRRDFSPTTKRREGTVASNRVSGV